MAASTLPPIAASNPRLRPPRKQPNPNPHRAHLAASACLRAPDEALADTRRRFLQAGAAAILVTPFLASEADATRIEYYATVGEPLCDLANARSGLGYCDVVVGKGAEPPRGQLINIHYTARFADGTVFDSSYKRGRPLTLRIGVGKVLPGLDQGIIGGGGVPPMLVGGKRKLRIPPELAYGPEPVDAFQVTATYLAMPLSSMMFTLLESTSRNLGLKKEFFSCSGLCCSW